MAGRMPAGERVVLFDDDHYYMGGVLAELLAAAGHAVTLVTPEARVSDWTQATMEQHRIQKRLLEAGVTAMTTHTLVSAAPGSATVACAYTEQEQQLPCDALVLVTSRLPSDAPARAAARSRGVAVRAIGDALQPGHDRRGRLGRPALRRGARRPGRGRPRPPAVPARGRRSWPRTRQPSRPDDRRGAVAAVGGGARGGDPRRRGVGRRGAGVGARQGRRGRAGAEPVRRPAGRPRARGRRRRRRGDPAGRCRAAGRRAGDDQGLAVAGRGAEPCGLAAARGLRAGRDLRGGAAADRRRRRDLRDHDDAGVLPDRRHRVEAARADAQPLEPRPDARRVVGRRGGGARGGRRAARAGRRRRRVDPHPRRLLRAGRVQAELRRRARASPARPPGARWSRWGRSRTRSPTRG